MGYGCELHKWDASHEAWQDLLAKLCKDQLAKDAETWGRDGQICPKCYATLVEDHEGTLDYVVDLEKLGKDYDGLKKCFDELMEQLHLFVPIAAVSEKHRYIKTELSRVFEDAKDFR